MNPNLEAALAYAAKGRAIFPCKGKIPATKAGFKDATTDIEQVTRWWTEHPTWTIGCPIPEGFIVIDVDAKSDGYITMSDLNQEFGVPETLTAYTGGGGLHLWYRYEGNDLRQGVGLLGKGIDTRTPGKGYIILPPSEGSMRAYEWADKQPTVDLPEWMAEKLRKPVTKALTVAPSVGVVLDPTQAYDRVMAYANSIRSMSEGSGRNAALNSAAFFAGQMTHHGLDPERAFEIIYQAAVDNGYVDKDGPEAAAQTIRSGINAGIDKGPEQGFEKNEPARGVVLPKPNIHSTSKKGPNGKDPLPLPGGRTIADLLTKEFEPLRWTVEDLVPEGLTLMVGTTKVGKSFFTLLMALKVAAGKPFLGLDTSGGEVLYIHLEDGDRRIQQRVRDFGANKLPHMDRFHHYKEWDRFGEGAIEALEAWMVNHPDTTLIVIDTIGKLRPVGSGKDPYAADYQLYGGLQSWALEHRIALVGVHHTNKGGSKELQDRISGTRGVAGAADTTLMLDRKAGTRDGRLATQGRDGPELDLALSFGENGEWKNQGEFWQWQQDNEQGEIEKAIRDAGGEATLEQIAQVVEGSKASLTNRLGRLVAKGQVTKIRHGVYGLPAYTPASAEPDEGPSLF